MMNCECRNATKWLYVVGVTTMIVVASCASMQMLRVDPIITMMTKRHGNVNDKQQEPRKAELIAMRTMKMNERLRNSQLILMMLSLFVYFRTAFTSPGSASDWNTERPDLLFPPSYEAQQDDEIESGIGIGNGNGNDNGNDNNNNERYCFICEHDKPRRVHHCSECGKCVLRFDHHCPWMGTCIGLKNGKFFMLFLVYTTLSAIHATFVTIRFTIHCYGIRHGVLPADTVIAMALYAPVTAMIAVPASVMVGLILGWNVWLGMRNETTLENMRAEQDVERRVQEARDKECVQRNKDEKEREILKEWEKERNKHRDFPSGGWLNNLRHVLGWNVLLWLIPIKQSRFPNCHKLATKR